MSGRMKRLLRGACMMALVTGLVLLVPRAARPQSLGLEVGWAGVEDHDPLNAAIGLALFVPVSSGWSASLSYTQWTGEAVSIGDQGLNALFYYHAFTGERFSWSLGAGLGLYEFFRVEEEARNRTVRARATVSSLIRYELGPQTGIYVRGDLSGRRLQRPTWGFLRMGFEWSPWK